jgi:colanic acid/amylovoran biosynthesis glycosyltransferase
LHAFCIYDFVYVLTVSSKVFAIIIGTVKRMPNPFLEYRHISMKIAFFTNGYPLVSEAFIQTSVLSLVERGHQVDVFGIGNAKPTGFAVSTDTLHADKHLYESITWPVTQVERLVKLPATLTKVRRRHGMGALLKATPSIYRRNFVDLTVYHQLCAVPANGDYDILHCQFATLGEFVAKHIDAGFLKGKLVCHFRGYDISEVPTLEGPDVYNHLWDRADGFIANCEYFSNRAISLGCPPEKIVTIGSGIDLARFNYTAPLTDVRKSGTLKCTLVGRLVLRKGFDDAFKALSIVKTRTGLALDVEIIGDGDERGALEDVAEACGLGDCVRFKGQQPHEYVRDRLRQTHLLLSPSRTSDEGGEDAPVNTLKEAMATGAVTVATRHGGIPELVEHGVTGFLSDERNPSSLADAIIAALEQIENWPEIANRALKRVQSMFDIDSVTSRQIELYDKVLNK